MAYCGGCGRYVGDYSGYRHKMSGASEIILCYRCKRWADRHPSSSSFPQREEHPRYESRRIRTFANIYIISSFGLFAFGVTLIVLSDRFMLGLLIFLGAISLFAIGLGMRRFMGK